MDDQPMQAIFEALGPIEAPAKQDMLTDARPYLTAPPIARLVGALVDALNSTKAQSSQFPFDSFDLSSSSADPA